MRWLFVGMAALVCCLSIQAHAEILSSTPVTASSLRGVLPVDKGGTGASSENSLGAINSIKTNFDGKIYGDVYAYPPTLSVTDTTSITSPLVVGFNGKRLQLKINATIYTGEKTLPFDDTSAVVVGDEVTAYIPDVYTVTDAFPSGTIVLSKTATSITLNNGVLANSGANTPIFFGKKVLSFPNIVDNIGNYYDGYWTSDYGSGAVRHDYQMIEFVHYGASFDVWFRDASASFQYWVFVDGKPTTANEVTGTSTSAGSSYFLHVVFDNAGDDTPRHRNIRIVLRQGQFRGLYINDNDVITNARTVQPKIAHMGDSFVEGVTGGNFASSDSFMLSKLLGNLLNTSAILNAGEGSTGFTTDGGGTAGKAAFTDAGRLASIKNFNPDIIVIDGTTNDNAATPAQVATAATTVLNYFKTNLPAAKIFLSGPQAYASNDPAAIANDLALQAIAASFGIPFLSPIQEQWVYGSGNSGTGTGNQATLIGSDGVHLSQAGNEFYARKKAAFISSNY